MEDKIQQARRELFEAAWLKSGGGPAPRFPTGVYIGHDTHLAWSAFNAALDCVVIELPKLPGEMNSLSPWVKGYEVCIKDSRAAIESTNLGIKVK